MKSSCQVWRVSLAAILGGVELVAQVNPAVQGSWEPPFQHVHASNVGAITGTDARVPFQPNPPAWPTASPSDGPQFNAVHMALIPRGPYQGMVLIWDRQNISPNNPAQSYQRYTIFDPTPGANPTFRNWVIRDSCG